MQQSNISKKHSVSKDVSSKIANMSLFGALLVISIHCGYSNSESGICWLVEQIFSGGYSRIAVPFFFLVSGYFLAVHIGEDGWWKKETLKRIRTIMLPFLTWEFIYQIIFMPLSIYADYRAGRPFGTNISFLNGNALCVFGLEWDKWPASIPLWFLRALFLFVIASPLVVFMLRKAAKAWFLILFICTIGLNYAPDPELGNWSGFFNHVFKISGFMYFSLGIYLRMIDIHFDSRRIAVMLAMLGTALLAIKGTMEFYESTIKFPFSDFAIPCLMFATWHFMPSREMPAWLKGTSFPIYLAHSIFLGYWSIFAKNTGIGESISKLSAWPMAFIGCVILTNILKKAVPRLSSFLFAGR